MRPTASSTSRSTTSTPLEEQNESEDDWDIETTSSPSPNPSNLDEVDLLSVLKESRLVDTGEVVSAVNVERKEEETKVAIDDWEDEGSIIRPEGKNRIRQDSHAISDIVRDYMECGEGDDVARS
jgi:hypothetical protein